MAVFTGTSGDDVVHGTEDADTFDLQAGGDDTAAGGLGDDEFDFGAALGAGDQVRGGKGFDTVFLDGDYSAGLVISDTMLVSVERMRLARGHDYDLTLSNTMIDPHGHSLIVHGDDLRAGDDMRIDASSIDHGAVAISCGAGDDLLIASSSGTSFNLSRGGADTAIGGAGDDGFGFGRAFTTEDRVDGGAGRDQVSFAGGSADPIVLGGEAVRDIEAVALFGSGHTDFLVSDELLDAGETLLLTAQKHAGFSFDGSAETDGAFDLRGGRQADHMVGGALADDLYGDYGADTLEGGGGGDQLSGGAGHDRFVYAAVGDSTVGAADTIFFLEDDDVIDLSAIDADVTRAGDQKFHLIGAFTGHARELVLTGGDGVTELLADVDGDGVADLQVNLDGEHGGFSHFKL